MIIRSLLLNDPEGIHYTLRVFIGITLLWFFFVTLSNVTPLWAVISFIVVTDPNMKTVWLTFKARIVNTVSGCIIALLFLVFLGHHEWLFPVALTVTAIVSTHVIRMPLGWRVGPVTTAIILAAGATQATASAGITIALERTMEVFCGSAMALFVTWVMPKIWQPLLAKFDIAESIND